MRIREAFVSAGGGEVRSEKKAEGRAAYGRRWGLPVWIQENGEIAKSYGSSCLMWRCIGVVVRCLVVRADIWRGRGRGGVGPGR